jgi:hypothetical protein
MSLESLYNQAPRDTYVGTVRTRQANDAPTNQTLVNFLDGQAKGRSDTQTPDQFQTEFTRNAPNAFVSAGAQGVARNPNQTFTRWTSKSFNLAFGNEGPAHLRNGFYTNQFRPVYAGIDGRLKQTHMYTPNTGRKFGDVNESARRRVNSSPSGAPTGV